MNENTKQEVKKEGLQLAEKVVKESIETTFTILDLIIKDSANKIDDLILPALPSLKALAIKYAEKIDGEPA